MKKGKLPKISPQIPKQMYDFDALMDDFRKKDEEHKKKLSDLHTQIFSHTLTPHDGKYCPMCQLLIKQIEEL